MVLHHICEKELVSRRVCDTADHHIRVRLESNNYRDILNFHLCEAEVVSWMSPTAGLSTKGGVRGLAEMSVRAQSEEQPVLLAFDSAQGIECVCVCICVCVCVCMCLLLIVRKVFLSLSPSLIYVYIYIDIYMYKHTHTCIHI